MDRRDRTLLYDSGEKGLVPGVELGRHSRRRDIDETVRSLLVEPDHPVPQRLTIHATDRGRLFPNDAQGKGGEAFDAPTYACRPPGVYHGPFKSDRGCLLYEFHYYDESKK